MPHPPRRKRAVSSNRTPANRRQPTVSALDQAIARALELPEPAATSFAKLGLPAALVTTLARKGMHNPFAIQARTLPDALAGRDILGRAQTGSGKTLAFGLPMLTRLATGSRRTPTAPRGLVLVPTRELAKQVADVLAPLGHSLGVTVAPVYGGAPMGRQIDRLRAGVDIVVATPGRLIDLMERRACRLDAVEVSVVDEADHMADLGFLPPVTRILDATPAGGQRMLFSATLDRGVDKLVDRFLDSPAVHAVAVTSTAVTAEHRVFVMPADDKVSVATQIANRPARTLFFVRTKHGADRLARQLTRSGIDAAAIHGNLNQNQRQRALDGFAAGHPRVLVATDVAARGIHVDDVDLVVHFDPPHDHKDYLHRSGRTARAGAGGTVLALVQPEQVRDVARLHDAAGVVATSDRVRSGDATVRAIGSSGEAIVVAARTERVQRPPAGPRAPGVRTPRPGTARSGTPGRRPAPHRGQGHRDAGRQRSRSAS